MRYVYFFYHHCYMSIAEQERLIGYIHNKDFDGFMAFYNWYKNPYNNPEQWLYLPDEIIVFNDKPFGVIDKISILDQKNFKMIDSVDSECG